MPSSSVRIGCALFVVAGISLLSGCSDGGTAVLEFGESDPLNGGMRPIPASLRVSVDERFGQFGELRLESMEPQEIPYESKNNPGTTFYKHRYRMRLTFVDDLDASLLDLGPIFVGIDIEVRFICETRLYSSKDGNSL